MFYNAFIDTLISDSSMFILNYIHKYIHNVFRRVDEFIFDMILFQLTKNMIQVLEVIE